MATTMRLLRTVCYTLTAPWQNWKVAIHQILLLPEHSTERVTTMTLWRKNRKTEYSTVTIVGTILGSVAISSMNLREPSTSHWTVQAFWQGTLTWSIFAVLIAFYLGIFIDTCETRWDGVSNLLQGIKHEQEHRVTWVYLFVLQSPIMLICYATVSYIIGLIIFLLQPLWQTEWGDKDKIAILSLLYLCFAIFSFLTVCITIYTRLLPAVTETNSQC